MCSIQFSLEEFELMRPSIASRHRQVVRDMKTFMETKGRCAHTRYIYNINIIISTLSTYIAGATYLNILTLSTLHAAGVTSAPDG